eukprot:tig00000144_g9158.t1
MRTRRKRAGGENCSDSLASVLESEAAPEQPSEDKVAAVLDQIDLEIESRSKKIISFANDVAAEIQNAFHVQLMKLPKKIRSMPVKHFCSDYKGEMERVIFCDVNSIVQDTISRTPAAARFTASKVSATPQAGQEPSTPSRSDAKRASARKRRPYASPKDVGTDKENFASIPEDECLGQSEKRLKAAGKPLARHAFTLQATASPGKVLRSAITGAVTAEGKPVTFEDLSKPEIKNQLSGEARKQAMLKLRELQEQLTSLMNTVAE